MQKNSSENLEAAIPEHDFLTEAAFGRIRESNKSDSLRVALVSLSVSSLFPISFFITDCIKGDFSATASYAAALLAILAIFFTVRKTGLTALAGSLVLGFALAGILAGLILPKSRNVQVVVFFCFVPFAYLLGGSRWGRGASGSLAFLVTSLWSARHLGWIGQGNMEFPLVIYCMAMVAILFQVEIAEANERRQGRSIRFILDRHYIDQTTGLPNQAAFLRGEIGMGDVLCLMHFATLRDLEIALSMEPGKAARRVSGLLKECIRVEGMRGPYRISDMDFVFVLPASADAGALLGNLVERFETECVLESSPARFCPCVAAFHSRGGDAALALDGAYSVLEDCLFAGKKWFFSDSPVEGNGGGELALRAAVLFRALASGGFEAVFQPVWDARTSRVGFIEALTRVRTVGGLESVEPYLAAARQFGLGPRISEFILDRARAMASESGLPVSFNITYEDLERPAYVERICRCCRELSRTAEGTEFPGRPEKPAGKPGRLIVELTEHDTFRDHSRVDTFIRSVHEAGGLVYLDDFGSGYSNYASLLGAGFDAVKIAGSIMKETAEREDAVVLLRGMAAFCSVSGLEIVAEHVSDKRILSRALENGARYIQGYLYARPMTEAATKSWLEDFAPRDEEEIGNSAD